MLVERLDTFGAELRRVFIHIRWPVQSYVVLGFLFGAVVAKIPLSGLVVEAFISWLMLVSGLTVLNSYYDKDDVQVGGMENPPEIAISLLYGSLMMLFVSLVMAFFISHTFFYLALMVAVAYFFYSHEATRWKSNGYVAVSINALVGALTLLAAGSLGGSSLLLPALVLSAVTAAFFKASVYTMMQVHQIDEDKKRGDTSIAVIYGRRATLTFSLVTMLIGGIFATAAVYMMSESILLPLLATIYFLATVGMFGIWIRQDDDPRKDARRMQRMIYFTGYVGSLTFAILYIYLSSQGFNL